MTLRNDLYLKELSLLSPRQPTMNCAGHRVMVQSPRLIVATPNRDHDRDALAQLVGPRQVGQS